MTSGEFIKNKQHNLIEYQRWFFFYSSSFVSSYIFEPLNISYGPSYRLTQFFLENLQLPGNIWIPPLKNMLIFVKCQQFISEILDISLTKDKFVLKLQISHKSLSAVTVKSQFSTDCLGKVKIYKSNLWNNLIRLCDSCVSMR